MLAQRRPDEQVYVGPTSVSNVGPKESTTEKLRWPNVVMLSGEIPWPQSHEKAGKRIDLYPEISQACMLRYIVSTLCQKLNC